MTRPFALAACAEMLWPEQPMEWRVRRLTELGFGVGLWNWPDLDLDAPGRSGAAFTIMNGYLQGRLRRRRFRGGAGGVPPSVHDLRLRVRRSVSVGCVIR